MKVLRCFPLDTCHKMIVLSEDPEAKYFPVGENAKLLIGSEWP